MNSQMDITNIVRDQLASGLNDYQVDRGIIDRISRNIITNLADHYYNNNIFQYEPEPEDNIQYEPEDNNYDPINVLYPQIPLQLEDDGPQPNLEDYNQQIEDVLYQEIPIHFEDEPLEDMEFPLGFLDPVNVRLTNEEFDRLPVRTMSKKLIKELDIQDKTCPICQDEINPRCHCNIFHCGHIFHKKCAHQWLTKHCEKPICPMCRIDVRNDTI